jgi:hypothetical protein
MAPYLRHLADEMGLRDWTVFVHSDSPDDNRHMAEADCVYGQKRINVSVADKFFGGDEEDHRKTLVHELIHAHLAPMHHYLHRVLEDSEFEAYQLTMEYAVDGMAEEWAKHLPLPSQILDSPSGDES